MIEEVGLVPDQVGQVIGRARRAATTILPIVKNATAVGPRNRPVPQLTHIIMVEADMTRIAAQEAATALEEKSPVEEVAVVVVVAPITEMAIEIETEIESESMTVKGTETATVREIEIGIETVIVIGIEEEAAVEDMEDPREVI